MDARKLVKLQKVSNVLGLALKACREWQEILEELEQQKRKRTCWVREMNRTRNTHGFFYATFLKMKEEDHGQFFIYTRMSVPMFNTLLSLIKPHLEKHSCNHPIEAECRLAILLLYLSQGTSIQKIAWSFKIGKETVRSITLESAEALWMTLAEFYVPEPNEADLRQIESDYWTMWNFPNCIGAIDGKHVAVQCPPNSGSQFFNNKKFNSIVLMAACDAKYRFTHVDVGAYGSQHDGGIFQESIFGKNILQGRKVLPDKALPGTNIILPHYYVGDAAFPLAKHVMRPYAGLQLPHDKDKFNNRLSRARRTIENAFGILVARWRILATTLHMYPENAT